MNEKIVLHLDPRSGWLAEFVGNIETIRAVGGSFVPTPFTAEADPTHVLATIRALNPGAVVSIAEVAA